MTKTTIGQVSIVPNGECVTFQDRENPHRCIRISATYLLELMNVVLAMSPDQSERRTYLVVLVRTLHIGYASRRTWSVNPLDHQHRWNLDQTSPKYA